MERITDTYLTRDGGAEKQFCSNTYDLNGNMTRDLNKGIRSVTYNTLNLPQSVLFTDGHITRYTYASDGRKLRVEHLLSNFTITDPVGRLSGHAGGSGASTMSFGGEESPLPLDSVALPPAETTLMTRDYCGNHIYRNGVLERVLNDVGYADSTGYHYQVKDYRGDVRAVVSQNGTLEETNSYYPYGMLHGTSAIASTQPYKYTGKELDRENGLDWYDFHARMLMSDQGRTTSLDPLAEKYYCMSPYLWCGGNPVKFVDTDGKDINVIGDYKSFLSSFNAASSNVSYSYYMGKIYPSGGKITNIVDLMIAYAAYSKTYTINIYAGEYPDVLGGTFLGSQFTDINEKEQVVATQKLNLKELSSIEEFYGMERGVAVLHEILEAIIGAIEYPGADAPQRQIDENGDIITNSVEYNNSHNKAKTLDQRFIEPNYELREDNILYMIPW